MQYFEYYIHCQRLPDRKTLHAVVTNFFGKKDLSDINYRVLQEGKGIHIYTDMDFDNEFTIRLANFHGRELDCKLLRKEAHELVMYQQGQEVTISGVIAYGAKLPDKPKTRKYCPFYMGQFVSPELKDRFKKVLQKSLGIRIDRMPSTSFARVESEIVDDHVRASNIIDMDLEVTIEEPEIFNQIAFKAFLQQKSYGFGNIEVIS